MSRAEDIFQKLIYFGEEAIDDYIVNSQTEELFLDFKRADSTGKNGLALHKDDRRNPGQGHLRVRQLRRRGADLGGGMFAQFGSGRRGAGQGQSAERSSFSELAGKRHFRLHHSQP